MKALKLLMKDCERGILSGTFEPTLDWAKEVLEAYENDKIETTKEDFQELRSALSEIYDYADRGLDILRSLED